jgi:hypothetical protein
VALFQHIQQMLTLFATLNTSVVLSTLQHMQWIPILISDASANKTDVSGLYVITYSQYLITVFQRECLNSWRLLTVNEVINTHTLGDSVVSPHVRCQVLTAASIKMRVFWHIAPCSVVGVERRFRGAYCLHHHPDDGASVYSETTRRYIP